MATFLILLNLFNIHFLQKWDIPYGNSGSAGRTLLYDSDHDGRIELIFRPYLPQYNSVYFAEFVPPDSWDIFESNTVDTIIVWDIGDCDNDGLTDLVVYACANPSPPIPLIAIYESPDSFSYPAYEVWRDTVGSILDKPFCIYDVDGDGFCEIFNNRGRPPNWLWIYEAIANNQYDSIFTTNPDSSNYENPASTYAFGDFDADGKIEFVFGGTSAGPGEGASFWVYESPANNTYERIIQSQVPTKNIRDCFTIPDADGDGKIEFVIKGFTPLDARCHVFIFEAVTDNTYEVIKSFDLATGSPPNMGYYGGYSATGDIDADGVPEIALEASWYVYLIKSCGNDSFYILDTLPGNGNGSSIQVYDFDGNGLSEIAISGNNEIRIYEKGVDMAWFCPVQYDTFYALDTVNLRWAVYDTFQLDSLYLYLYHPQIGRWLIYQGLPTDTNYEWVLPDTQSLFKIWLVVAGFGRRDSMLSPLFYIKQQGSIAEQSFCSYSPIPSLQISPNPFRSSLVIRYALSSKYQGENNDKVPTAYIRIYDAAGRLIRQWNDKMMKTSDYLLWNGTDDSGSKLPCGIYFVELKKEDLSLMEKVIKLK
ncbi:MAG: T9SS type A sorting domain-containing protein [candidate division WOR-3 bacterium]